MNKREMQRPGGRGKQEQELTGWLREFFSQFELAWRLLWDERVPMSTKLVPFLAIAYIILPFDLLPDYFLGMGQVDDLVILLVGLRMFISLCPPGVVAEFNRLRGNPDGMEDWEDDEVEIIDLDAEAPKRHSDGSDT
jgi:uncharacterized membrane protein YkvA (DUF1232 family)